MILTVGSVSKSFGTDVILENVSFRIDRGEKVALVGRNGTGKTTLLRIITGSYEPDGGTVQVARGARIGYLRQDMPVSAGRTVREEAQQGVAEQLSVKAHLDALERRLEEGAPSQEDLEEYATLHERFMESGGYSAHRDVDSVLLRMGFEADEMDKPTGSLSGGEKTRLALARLLLEEPDLLILDEPTNHLDLQATEWLESWLRQYPGAVLLVSHDRAFLDVAADRVLELREQTVKAYPGPFEKYMRLRAEEDARLVEVARRQDNEIAKMDEYVRRFMNSQRTAQARGRQKLMNRLIANRVEAPRDEKGMKAGFGDAARSGDLVMVCEKLKVGFPGATLIESLDWTPRIGERWGIIGENGAGKSTLMKVCMGDLDPLAGRARLGASVSAGYFTQDASDLDPDSSALDTMVYDLDLKPPEARDLLARFLITGDDVYRPIRTLSGGERNKLSLAKLTQLNPNLLVLDEPTNHLDMASREALAKVLRDYKGTLVLVSHDRWLLGETTDHILDVRKSGAVQFPGGYVEYRTRRDSTSAPASTAQKKTVEPPKPVVPTMSPRELSKEISRLQKLVVQIEGDIAAHEDELKRLEDKLANLPPTADVYALTQEHAGLQEALDGKMAVWEATSTELETRKAEQVGA
ncbi:ABC transporter ATP-binding protein [bacterium]|nr:MAG: ABC transporter ATP-binding protein [bacterium]